MPQAKTRSPQTQSMPERTNAVPELRKRPLLWSTSFAMDCSNATILDLSSKREGKWVADIK